MQSISERLQTIEEGHWLLICAPRVEHMITGTTKVGILRDGLVKVVYEDGKQEERQGTPELLNAMDADNPSVIKLVSFVQDGRA